MSRGNFFYRFQLETGRLCNGPVGSKGLQVPFRLRRGLLSASLLLAVNLLVPAARAQTAHGVISFVTETNHVCFDIDDASATQGGVVICSKLLDLAHAVKQRSHP